MSEDASSTAPPHAHGEPDPRPRYRMTLAYDGSGFHGWQKQEPPDGEPLRTVAGEVEGALQRTLMQPINLVGASRTDAGVHALGQVAHFNAESRIPDDRMARAINSRLPDDIDIIDIQPTHATFDAISDAARKQYRYRLFNSDRKPLDRRHHVYHCFVDLDIDRMQDAAKRLEGEHDFEGFAAAGHGRSSTVRTIFDCHIETPAASAHCPAPEVHIVVQGSGFLYNMVRIIAGTLVEVGRGRFEPGVIDEVLASTDRAKAGPTLGPEGLWLEWIEHRRPSEADVATEGP